MVSDHCFLSSSEVFDIFSQRYIRKEKYSCHEEFDLIRQEEGWDLKECNWVNSMIVRPMAIKRIPDPSLYFDQEIMSKDYVSLYGMHKEWLHMDMKDKIGVCGNTGIDPRDYEFQVIVPPDND
jgi:hypothetical protein